MLLKKMHYKCETAHPSLQTRGGGGGRGIDWPTGNSVLSFIRINLKIIIIIFEYS
jgi:hypothetical protein